MITAIAIDDEPVALDIIRMHATKVPFIDLKEVFYSARTALDYLKRDLIDLVFLDINMPDTNGLEFAALIPPGTRVVFTTAHEAYALAGFDLAITDFLLKPINFNRFLQACQQVENRSRIQDNPGRDSLFVKDGYKWIKINLRELLYVKGEDNYLSLMETGKQTLVRMTLQEISQKLPENFIKVHKSYIVNTAFIQDIKSNQLTIAGARIPIAKPFLTDLKSRLL